MGIEALEARALLSAGAVDLTFGSAGGLTPLLATRPLDVNTVAAARTPDGGTLVVGNPVGAVKAKLVMAKFAADGSLDGTFGRQGMLVAPTDASLADAGFPAGVAVDASGRIYLATIDTVVRLLPNGSLDPSFGDGGAATAVLYARQLTAVAVAPDGTVWAAGISSGASGARRLPIVLHLGGDGSLLGVGGVAAPGTAIRALAVQRDGKVIAAGGNTRAFSVMRFNADASPDTSFGDGGVATVAGSGGRSHQRDSAAPGFYFNAIALTRKGEVIAAGGAPRGQVGPMVVAEFGRDGRLDPAFGRRGGGVANVFVVDANGGLADGEAAGVAILGDGDVLLSGTVRGATDATVSARLTPTGKADVAYGNDAGAGGVRYVTRPVDDASTVAPPFAAGLLLGDGGAFEVPTGGGVGGLPCRQLAVYSLDAAGQLTTAHRGRSVAPIGQTDQTSPTSIQTDAAGDVYVAESRGANRSSVVRLLPDGAPDSTFGSRGALDDVKLLAVTPDGKLYVSAASGSPDLLRLNADGTPDVTFGVNGVMHLDDTAGAVTTVFAALPRLDGSLVVEMNVAGFGQVVQARSATGQLTGRLAFPTGTQFNPGPSIGGLTLTPDESAVLAEIGHGVFASHFDVNRYDATDLTPDPAFGSNGSASVQGLASYSLAVAPDGSAYAQNVISQAVVRLDPSGVQDASFGQSGSLALDEPATLLVTADGKLLAVSQYVKVGGAVIVRRFNADGWPDATFGVNGQVTLFRRQLPAFSSVHVTAALQPTAGGGQQLLLGSTLGGSQYAGRYGGGDSVGFLARIDL